MRSQLVFWLGFFARWLAPILIVQRMALLGDVIAHAVLPGLGDRVFLGR
jgi:ABC-type Mn2+/Zn2+ transport system permease subunit